MVNLKRSCLCGRVGYEIDHDIPKSGHCHCSNYRKASVALLTGTSRVRPTIPFDYR